MSDLRSERKDGEMTRADTICINPPRESVDLHLRGLRYHVRRWGNPHARPLLLLHGVRDCAATFQFMIDELKAPWNIVAPDWRGHGLSDRAFGSYWVHDFIADLDALLATVFPGQAVDIIAHSLGGNVGSLYCGLRPDRVKSFVSLDAAGPMARRLPADPYRLLNDWLGFSAAHPMPRGYETLQEVAARLRKANRRITAQQADYLAAMSTGQGPDGRYRWLFDPAMKHSLPTLHTSEEWRAVWSHLKAPFLWIGSTDLGPEAPSVDEETIAQCRSFLPHAEFVRLDDTGHNLHHDRPAAVADLAEAFLLRRSA
jgi:pimeloyl-ACP methyl ester carboxylesterase